MSLSDGRNSAWNRTALIVIIAVGIAFAVLRQFVGHGDYLLDLRAFYCAGSVLLHHSDPYYSASATACVHGIKQGVAVMRAPHPPFALTFYALLALLPFSAAAVFYLVSTWIAIGANAYVLSKLTHIPSSILALGLVPVLGHLCLSLGQPTAFVVLAIVLSAYFLVHKRLAAASACAAFTLLYPHIGLPIVATLFICNAGTRRPLSVAIGFLVLVGLLVLGPSANVHYITVSLHQEGAQIFGDGGQYSLPWLLMKLHFSTDVATLAGSIWYVAVFLGGLIWLKRNSARNAGPLTVLIPAALAVLSSPFVHPQHFALVMPLAFFGLSTRPKSFVPLLAGTALLIVPWNVALIAGPTMMHDAVRVCFFVAMGTAFALLVVRFGPMKLPAPIVTLAPAVVALTYLIVCTLLRVTLHNLTNADLPPDDLVSALAIKLPTVLGLLLVIVFGAFAPDGGSPFDRDAQSVSTRGLTFVR